MNYGMEIIRQNEHLNREVTRLRAELDQVAGERDKLLGVLECANKTAKRRGEERDALREALTEDALREAMPAPEGPKCPECSGRGGYGETSFEGTCSFCGGTGRAK